MQAVCPRAVEDILIGRKHLIASADGQGRDVAVVVQSGLAERGHARAQVELGDTRAVGECLFTDRGHRIRQGHGLHARPAEPEVSDSRQLVQVGTEIDAVLGSHSLEGASLNRDSAAQVDAVEAGREAEGARAHRVEALWQGQRGEGGEAEGLVADGAQRRRQSDGHDTRLGEGLVGDLGRALRDRVGAAGVLRRRVHDQTRVVLREQDTVHGLVVGVRAIGLDRGQGGRLSVARGDRLGGDLRAEGQRGQSLVVVDELGTNHRDGTRQGQGFQRHVREGSLADRRQLRGRGHVILEGNCLQRGVDERLVADGTHGGGDRHVLHGGVREGSLPDVGDALGKDNVGRTALVDGQHAVLVDLEVVGIGGAHGHGDLRGLGRAARGHGCAQRASTGVVTARQRRARRIRASHNGRQIGGFNAPGHRGTRQGGSQVRLHRGLLARLHGQGGLLDLNAGVLGDRAHVDGGRGRQSRLGSVSRGDRRVTRAHRADLAGVADGRHGLVRGGPHQVGDVRVRRLVRGAQRDLLIRYDRGLGGRERQGRHRDGLEAQLLAGLILTPVPRVQVGGRRIRGVRAVDQILPGDLVVLGVGTVGLTVRAHGFLLVVVVTRRGRLGERDTGQRRVIGDVEGHDATVPLAGHRNVRDRGGLGVQRELPRQLLRRGRGRNGGSFDGQRVAAVGQLVAVFVEAVENRVVSLLAFNGQDRARGVVEQGLLRALEGVGAHGFPCLVRVRVGQLRSVAQQARAREHLARRFLRGRARHDEVRGVDGAHGGGVLAIQRVECAQGHVRRWVHEGRGAGVRGARRSVVPLAVEDIRDSPGAVEAHVGHREVRLPVGAREGDRAVDECALGGVGVRVRGEGRLRGHRDGYARAGLSRDGHRVSRKSQVDACSRPVLRMLREELALHDLRQGLAAECVGVSVIGDVG